MQALARKLTREEVEAYREHGVVKLQGILDPDWVKHAETVFEAVMNGPCEPLKDLDVAKFASQLEAQGVKLVTPIEKPPASKFRIRTFMWRDYPELEELSRRGQMPELAAELLGAQRINFFGDQLFEKQPGSLHRTGFHQDAGYFHLSGEQCCSIWMPFDRVDSENGVMGYVRGSHTWKIHAANPFVSQVPLPGSVDQPLPDIEGHESDYDIAYLDAEPGDAIVHHVRTVHGSTGNTSTTRGRRALALRYLGDDVRYLERPGAPPDSQKSAALAKGDLMDSEEFPLIWTAEAGLAE